MNTEQALELLVKATANIQTTRENHLQILKAIEILKNEIQKRN